MLCATDRMQVSCRAEEDRRCGSNGEALRGGRDHLPILLLCAAGGRSVGFAEKINAAFSFPYMHM